MKVSATVSYTWAQNSANKITCIVPKFNLKESVMDYLMLVILMTVQWTDEQDDMYFSQPHFDLS